RVISKAARRNDDIWRKVFDVRHWWHDWDCGHGGRAVYIDRPAHRDSLPCGTVVTKALRFYAVGLAGIFVQLAALTLLKSGFGMGYLSATAIAVEVAVLHNFFWHERWTWADRGGLSAAGKAGRLVRFHLSNGLLSILGTLVLMA